MSDIFLYSPDRIQLATKKPEIIFTANAKPTKEKIHPDFGVATSLDIIADKLQEFGTLDNSKINQLTDQIEKQQYRFDAATRNAVNDNLQLLKREMETLELMDVADALASVDSPWGSLVQDIAESDRLKQSLPDKKLREQYVDKLLFPIGAQVFREIRSMTTDPLTVELMFHSFSEGIRSNPDAIHTAHASIPLPKDTGTVKQTMRRVSVNLLGIGLSGHETNAKIDALYNKGIHTAALRSRLSAEQPQFDIDFMEYMLKAATQEEYRRVMPFAKDEAAQTLRETQSGLNEMKRIRNIVDKELPNVQDETTLMRALDNVQAARFDGAYELAPYKLESWVPEHIRQNARIELEMLTRPKEDLYAKVLKKLDAVERRYMSKPVTRSETKYKDHMKWLTDPVAQATRKQRVINIIDLVMTVTTLVFGVTGGIQRQIEGGSPSAITVEDFINKIESQRPWEIAADLATPKIPKLDLSNQAI